MTLGKSSATGAILLLVGVGLGIGGGVWFARNRALARSGTRAEGTVVGVTRRTRRSGRRRRRRTTYAPTVRFEAADDKTVTFEGSGSSSQPTKGDKVAVLYDPSDPEGSAKLDTFSDLWLGPMVLGGMGLIFAAIGIAGLLRAGRRSAGHALREDD